MNLSDRQWEIILQGLVSRRDLLVWKLEEVGQDHPGRRVWERTRDDCQNTIDEICRVYPEAKGLYYTEADVETSPL